MRSFLLGLLVLTPSFASAATMYVEAPSIAVVGNVVSIGVYVDTDTNPANALDGTLDVSQSSSQFDIQNIDLTHSVLELWPVTPALTGQTISFTGGKGGGFSGSHQLLFTILLTPKTSGVISFNPTNSVLYLNDGKGTPTPLESRPYTLTVAASHGTMVPYLLGLVILLGLGVGIGVFRHFLRKKNNV